MSRKQRVLRNLRTLESELLKSASTIEIMERLVATRDICRQGMTENVYAKYKEVYDGLILAADQMLKNRELSLNEETFSLFQELLQYIISETEQEERFKKDIFFLPYKASMWDSLESVWKATYADKEHYNAYVMPIPYCDRNPDKSVKEWHFERDLFPDYVPVLDCREVDLKEWSPDIVVYHNPYDGYNLTTSVDSRYYSYELKKYANKIVYIPYFIVDEPCTEKGMEIYVLTPGVVEADKIIVQSGTMRELYINILARETDMQDRAYWEARVSGAGSPLIEKVLTSQKEDFCLPAKWAELIKSRKVILYNTSINANLADADKVCDKLRQVFDFFRNNRDFALWWRPHPLMKAAFHSMRPQIEKEYAHIEKQYISEGWGIYDDTPEMSRAICYGDAYYGDRSSVLFLYKRCHKPAMLQKLGFGYDYLSYRLSAVFMDDKFIYLTSNSHRGAILCKMNRNDGDITVKFLQDKNGNTFHTSVLTVAALNSKLLLCPYRGNNPHEFIIYDISNDDYTFLHIEGLEDKLSDPRYRFWFRFPKVYNGKFFVGAHSLPVVASIDLEQKKYNLINGLDAEALKDRYDLEKQIGWHSSCVVGGHLYALRYNYNNILDVDLEAESIVDIKAIGNEDLKFHMIATDGKVIWLIAVDGKIVKWNPVDDSTYIYSEKIPQVDGKDCFANGFVFYSDNFLYMICSLESADPMCVRVKFDTISGIFSNIEYINDIGRLNGMLPTENGQFLLSSKYRGVNKVFLMDSLSSPKESWREWKVQFSDEQESAVKNAVIKDYIDDIEKEEVIAEGEYGIEMSDFMQLTLNYDKVNKIEMKNKTMEGVLSYGDIL